MEQQSAAEAVRPLLGTAIFFLIINTVFLGLRFYTVCFLRTKRLPLTWDDYFLIPAYLFIQAIAICGLVMHHYEGDGNPPYSADEPILVPERLEPILACIWAILLVLVAGYACTRFSILMFYLRVFTGKWARRVSYFFLAFIAAQWFAFSMATIFQCKPVAYYWNRELPGGTCFDVDRFNKSFTPVNIAADSVILLIPLPIILWRLQVSALRKIGYTFILGLGSFALAASIVRAVVLDRNTTIIITPTISNLEIEWLIIEPSIYFITACLPTMHPLFRLCIPDALRRATEGKLALARHDGAGGAVKGDNSFARLSEEDLAAKSSTRSNSTVAHAPPPPPAPAAAAGAGDKKRFSLFGGGGGGGSAESRAGVSATRSKRGKKDRDGSQVPMQDLAQLEAMKGIMVHTEITVSQEDRMEDVMGF